MPPSKFKMEKCPPPKDGRVDPESEAKISLKSKLGRNGVKQVRNRDSRIDVGWISIPMSMFVCLGYDMV